MRRVLNDMRGGVRSILRQPGVSLIAILCLALGIGAALAASRLIASQLYDVAPNDPATFAFTAAALAVVAMLATYLPARRATRVDPMEALRYE